MNPPAQDRREEPRTELERPCKVFDPRRRKYVSGSTRNISSHGVLVETARRLDLPDGAPVHLGIALKRHQCLLAQNEMIEARVVRTAPSGSGRTTLAVRLREPLPVRSADCDTRPLAA